MDSQSSNILWTKQVVITEAGFSEGLTLSADNVLYVLVNETPNHPHEASIVTLQTR